MRTNNSFPLPKVWLSLWQVFSLSCALLFLVPASDAISLTGLLQHGTVVGDGGRTGGSPMWNTLGNEASFANIYLTEPNGGYEAPLLNSGNGAAASIAYDLAPGTYEFFFFVDGFWANNPGEYGLNLFFDGDNVNPGIAAFSPKNLSSENAAEAGVATHTLDGLGALAPTPSDLSYWADGLRITLTSYGFGEPGVFGGPPLDRVGNVKSIPDGFADGVGRFTLKVETLPVPDSDEDGIPDEYETNDGNYHSRTMTGTDPQKPDTDGDGLSDGVEVLTLGTDPNRVDTDGDGLDDGAEVNLHGTNPLLADTDGDLLSDPVEITATKTNPLVADSDGNGITDAVEDLDKDGFTNLQEVVLLLTDPLDGTSRFAIELTYSSSAHTVTFPALSGRSYLVERSVNMDDWAEVITFIGTGSTVSIPLGPPFSQRWFYRVGVKMD